MSLSLEVKKFINSEHSGEFVEISLPGMIPGAKPAATAATAATAAGGVSAEALREEPVKDPETEPVKDPETEFAGAKPKTKPDRADDEFEDDKPLRRLGKKNVETVMEHETARIHYFEAGQGEPLLLIHTVGQSLYTWRGVFQRLSEHYRVFAVDLPGHGYSDRPETFGYTVEEYSDALRRFMDAVGLESAHMMAFSLGCAYAMRFALDYPERLGRLVLLSPGGVTPEMPLAIKLVDSPVFGLAASWLYSMGTTEKLLNDAVFDLTNITPDVVQEYYRPISDGAARRAVRKSLQYFDDEPIVSRLREAMVPALILTGSEDKWHPAAGGAAELYHAAMRNAGFAVIRNAGHLLHEEKPDRIIAALLEFIPVVMP